MFRSSHPLWQAVFLVVAAFIGLNVVAVGSASAGAIVYQTGFENPPYNAGGLLVGTGGWTVATAGPDELSPNAAKTTTTSPKSGQQAVEVRGGDLTFFDVGYVVGAYRNVVNYDTAVSNLPIVRIQAAVRVDGPGTAQTPNEPWLGDFFSANLQARSGDGDYLGELWLSSDGHVYGGGAGVNDYYLFGSAAALGQYHTLAMDIDFLNRQVNYLLNGSLLGTTSFADPGITSSVFGRGVLLAVAIDDPDRERYTARFDDYLVTADVPEPTSIILASIGAVAIAGIGRRERRRATAQRSDG